MSQRAGSRKPVLARFERPCNVKVVEARRTLAFERRGHVEIPERKEVNVALLFPTIAVDSLDCFRSGDHNYHHRTSTDHHKPL